MRGHLGAIVGLAALLGACGSDAAPGLGHACSATDPCGSAVLLCVDGVCVDNPVPIDVPEPTDATTPIEIVATADSVAVDTVATDSAVFDANLTDSSAPSDVVLDTDGPIGDVVTTLLVVGDHEAVDNPSDDALTLQPDQGAVSELRMPAAGRLVAIEILATDSPGGPSCASYRPTVWLPDDDGTFDTTATWSGTEIQLQGEAELQLIEIDGPELPVGAVRIGWVLGQICQGFSRQPLFAVDATGVIDTTFVWASVGDAATWVPATALSLSGRWALRVTLAITGG